MFHVLRRFNSRLRRGVSAAVSLGAEASSQVGRETWQTLAEPAQGSGQAIFWGVALWIPMENLQKTDGKSIT